MKPTVNVCDGCCCGRVNKSNLAVPKDELKTLWRAVSYTHLTLPTSNGV